MIDVLDADLGLDPIEAHRLEFQHDQCTGRVLRQCLVDTDPNFLAGLHLTVHQMRLNQLLSNIQAHDRTPIVPVTFLVNLTGRGPPASSVDVGARSNARHNEWTISSGMTFEDLNSNVSRLDIPDRTFSYLKNVVVHLSM